MHLDVVFGLAAVFLVFPQNMVPNYLFLLEVVLHLRQFPGSVGPAFAVKYPSADVK